MAPIKTQWTRLIRFVAAETFKIHIGEPADPNLDVGLAAAQGTSIKAYEIIGSPLDPAAQVTKTVLTVLTLLSPLSNEEIKVVRGLGMNYADSAAEANAAPPKYPVLFYKPLTTLLGPLGTIVIPPAAQPVQDQLPDYEAELVIVIGKAAKDVSEADALDYVLAYTGANDVSFRKHQFAVSQWGFSKSFDNTNPVGPCLVSNSAIPEPQKVSMKCVLNGQKMQDSSAEGQIFGVRQTIAYLSQGTTLEPGTIIMTGSPAGSGYVKKPPVYLKDGDKVDVWLSHGIGSLVNSVKEERAQVKAKL